MTVEPNEKSLEGRMYQKRHEVDDRFTLDYRNSVSHACYNFGH